MEGWRINKFLGLYRKVLDLQKELEKLQKRLSNSERDRNYFKSKFEQEQEKTALLQEDAADLSRVCGTLDSSFLCQKSRVP